MTYQPQLTDVARLVTTVATANHSAENEPLFQWLLKRWLLEQPLLEQPLQNPVVTPVDLTPVDLAELRLCLHTGVSTPRALQVAELMLTRAPETAALLERLEIRGRDLGLGDGWKHEAERADQLNNEVDRLVESHDWDMAARFIEANVLGEPIYEQWVVILEARIARGDGDVERLETVRDKLRTEATTLQNSFSMLLQGDFSAFLGNDREN